MAILLWLLLTGGVPALVPPLSPLPEPPHSATAPEEKPQPPTRPHVEEAVEVVGSTPLDGLGLPKDKVPANVQVVTAGDLKRADNQQLTGYLGARLGGVNLDEAYGSAFQPDVLFRGFAASPLLGSPQGLAVYQDGVRLNEPFGDTVSWELVPESAIESVTLMPGSNPLFGLNTLGGALSYRTKDGFSSAGRELRVRGGSFGRRSIEFETGGHDLTKSYFVTGSLLGDNGWRALSPTHIGQLFSSFGWRGRTGMLGLSATVGRSDLAGDGTVPADLLREDRHAIYTYPDDTRDNLWMVTLKGRRSLRATAVAEGTLYYRSQRFGVVNGNTADLSPCEGAGVAGLLCGNAGATTSVVTDVSGHPVPAVTVAGPINAIDDLTHLRSFAYGASGQSTIARAVAARANRLVAGLGLEAGGAAFDSDGRLSVLTPARATVDLGIVQAGSQVRMSTRTTNISAYATDTIDLTRRLAATASARINTTALRLRDRLGGALNGDHVFTRLNPAAGATYRLLPRLNLYGGYSESSRVPTAVELTCAHPDAPCRLPNALLADPPLEQIVAQTWEGGVRGRWRDLQASVAVFSTAIANDLLFVGNGSVQNQGYFANVGTTTRRGIEARADARPLPGLSLFAAYTRLSARFAQAFAASSPFHPLAVNGVIEVPAGARLPGVPGNSLKAGVEIAPMSRLDLTLTSQVASSSFLRGDETNALAPLPGYLVVDARARCRVSRHLVVDLQADNLLNRDYVTFGVLGDARPVLGPGAIDPRFLSPGAPRALWVGLTLR